MHCLQNNELLPEIFHQTNYSSVFFFPFLGQQNEGLNFYNHYVNQPNSTQEIQEIDMESTGENDEPDLNALVRYLIATARRNGLEVISRFIRMLEAAIEAM